MKTPPPLRAQQRPPVVRPCLRSYLPAPEPEDELGCVYDDTDLPKAPVSDHEALRTEDRPYG